MTIEGIGIGFRFAIAEELLKRRPQSVGWVEIHPENYMERGGKYPRLLRECLDAWPVVTHGLTMGFGTTDPHPREYLDPLRQLLHDVRTPYHTDHMCFPSVGGAHSHDLLPLPFTEEAANTVVQRLQECREHLGLPLGLENVSYYAPAEVPLEEADFIAEVSERADAGILLDVNNVYVNSINHHFDPRDFIDRIPGERVLQIHVAGHFVRSDELIIDTHGESVCEGVYDLLEYTLKKMGPKAVLLERDNNIPALDELLEEIDRLHEIYDRAIGAPAC